MDIIVEATITYADLLKALKLELIPGLTNDAGEALVQDAEIELDSVAVDTNDASEALAEIGMGWDGDDTEPYSAPPPGPARRLDRGAARRRPAPGARDGGRRVRG